MYQVKRKGGGRHGVIDMHEQEVTEYSDSLQRDLGHAIKRHELRVEYQPMVRVMDGRINCVEAFLRWDHSGQGPISPAVLIPLAEQSGAITEIGEWVLEKACIDRHRWERQTGDDSLVMTVNISAHQLLAPGFVSTVEAIIARTHTKGEHLCLDVTESALVQDAERALTVLTQLKELGTSIALDDFGTGYSSLGYLRQFPIDVVKIDRSAIAHLSEGTSESAIVSKTIELAHLLKLIVVCEGVETAEQHRQVSVLASDFSQGFYHFRPMTADMIDQFASATASAWTVAA
jgi:EAL domain-containing protein (putative c-di-GMP-specific phosphodiesterase class I)